MAMHRRRVRKVLLKRWMRVRNASENIDEIENWMIGQPTEKK